LSEGVIGKMKKKVLIIKLGYIELLDNYYDTSIGLGDIFRCTPILHAFKDCSVTWLTDFKGLPLLEGNPLIDRLLFYDMTTVFQLQAERFDMIINLEKVPGICALADSLVAWQKYGFRYNAETGRVAAYLGSEEILDISGDNRLKKKRSRTRCFNDFLYAIIGRKWRGEGYVTGYKPGSELCYDVGFNTQVGSKWPLKAWPEEKWGELELCLSSSGYTFCYQRGLKDLREYIDWIYSCRLLVTNDSLGLHLALAFGRQVIALFGPTYPQEVFIDEKQGIKIITPADYECIPCLAQKCERDVPCINSIEVEKVFAAVQKILGCE
jgi:heptosyltransferase-2